MCWSHTSCVIALIVVYVCFPVYVSILPYVRLPVSANMFAVNPEVPIATFHLGACPLPAVVRFVNVVPESYLWVGARSAHRNYGSAQEHRITFGNCTFRKLLPVVIRLRPPPARLPPAHTPLHPPVPLALIAVPARAHAPPRVAPCHPAHPSIASGPSSPCRARSWRPISPSATRSSSRARPCCSGVSSAAESARESTSAIIRASVCTDSM